MKKEFTAKLKKGWRITGTAVMLGVTVLALSACKAGNKGAETSVLSEDRKAIVDDYAEIMKLQDQDSAVYDQILEEIAVYMEEPSQEKKEQTLALIEKTTADMAALVENGERISLDDEFSKLLTDNDISPAEYQANADFRYQYLAEYAQDMWILGCYMEDSDYDEQAMESLRWVYELSLADHKDVCGYNYTCVNYWFAGWEEPEVEYVKQTVLDQFQSFAAENPVWESDREAVELKLNTYLNQMEKRSDEMSDRIGQLREELYELKKKVKKQLESLGAEESSQE